MRRIIWIGLVVALCGTAPAAMADTVKVGLIISASGSFASWGTQNIGGIKAYQEQHGTKVDGNEIEVILRDDGGPDPSRAKQLAEELVLRDKVQFLAGFVFSPNAMAVSDIITEAKIPTIIVNAGTGIVTRKSPYFVRVSFTLPQISSPLGTWAATRGKIKTVVSVVADYVSGIDSADAFAKTFTANGGKVIETIRVPISVTDFAPYYERVLAEKPDAMFVFGPGGPNSLAMIEDWSKRLKPAGIAVIGGGQLQQIDLNKLGDAALGVVTTTHYVENTDNALNNALRATWAKDHPGTETVPDIATVASYDAMELIYRAVAKFGPHVTGDQAIGFYKGMKVASPRGEFMIDPKTRDIIQDIYITRVEKRDGVYRNAMFDVIKDVKDPWKEEHPE